MSQHKRIVLDANILIRAVLGERVGGLLASYESSVAYFTTTYCFQEAEAHLPGIAAKKRRRRRPGFEALEALKKIVLAVEPAFYEGLYEDAHRRIAARDPNDWPLVALALLLDCPIWTEDNDFFGVGVAVWNTQNVEYFLQD